MATLPPALRIVSSQSGRLAVRPLDRWHLLSLDAPAVAMLWTWFIARCSGFTLPWASLASMGLAVWILYAADRLMDARLLNHAPLDAAHDLEARHLFHHRHRAGFLAGIIVASIALTPLLLKLPAAAMRLYLVEATLLAAWFLLIHIAPAAHRLPKELAVGPFFAGATFIPTVARAPELRPMLVVPAMLFALLCSLNCLFIYAWENPDALRQERAHSTTRLGLRVLPLLPVALIVMAAVAAAASHSSHPLLVACALSAAALLALHGVRARVERTTLRAAADLALLTPLLLCHR